MIEFSHSDKNYWMTDKNPLPQWNPYAEGVLGKDIKSMRDGNACTVVALQCVTGNSYKQCYEYMKKFGRPRGKGMTTKEVCSALESFKRFKVVKGEYSRKNRITLNQFVKKHPIGKYYLMHRGHAFAVIDGVVHDHTNGKRRQVTCAYRVYSPKDLEELLRNKTK